MKFRIIMTSDIGYMPAQEGEIVEGILSHHGDFGAFYDKRDGLYSIPRKNFEIIQDDTAKHSLGISHIFGQELKRLEVEFK